VDDRYTECYGKVVELEFDNVRILPDQIRDAVGSRPFRIIVTLFKTVSPDDMEFFAEKLVLMNCHAIWFRGVMRDELENAVDDAEVRKSIHDPGATELGECEVVLTASSDESVIDCLWAISSNEPKGTQMIVATQRSAGNTR
jgi:hypothetical protein